MGDENPSTALVLNLTNAYPDYTSLVPHEKGSVFLWYLEDIVGGPAKFDPFLRAYLSNYKFKSLDSFEFQRFFLKYFANEPR